MSIRFKNNVGVRVRTDKYGVGDSSMISMEIANPYILVVVSAVYVLLLIAYDRIKANKKKQ